MTVKDREGDSFHFKLSLRKIDSRTPFKHFILSKIFKQIRDPLLICNLRISQLCVEIHRELILKKHMASIGKISRLNRL